MKSPSRCPACGRREKRSSAQNKRYWAIVARVAEGCHPQGDTYSVPTWHKWFKSHFLGCTETKLPNGATLTEPNSSADEDTPEFSDYMTAVEAWAAEHGVYLDD